MSFYTVCYLFFALRPWCNCIFKIGFSTSSSFLIFALRTWHTFMRFFAMIFWTILFNYIWELLLLKWFLYHQICYDTVVAIVLTRCCLFYNWQYLFFLCNCLYSWIRCFYLGCIVNNNTCFEENIILVIKGSFLNVAH